MIANLFFWFLMAGCVAGIIWLVAQAIVFTLAMTQSED